MSSRIEVDVANVTSDRFRRGKCHREIVFTMVDISQHCPNLPERNAMLNSLGIREFVEELVPWRSWRCSGYSPCRIITSLPVGALQKKWRYSDSEGRSLIEGDDGVRSQRPRDDRLMCRLVSLSFFNLYRPIFKV